MEIRDDWSPEAKFGPSVATLPTTITLNWVKSILASSLRRHNSPQDIPTRSWPLNGTNCSLVAIRGSGKSYCRNQTCHSQTKCTVDYERALAILGKIVGLISCVWKLGFMKSGHIYTAVYSIIWLCILKLYLKPTYDIRALSCSQLANEVHLHA